MGLTRSFLHPDSTDPELPPDALDENSGRSSAFPRPSRLRGASLDSSTDSKLLYVAEAALADSRLAMAEESRGRNEVGSAL